MTTKSNMVFSVCPRKGTPREHYRVDKDGCETMKQNVLAFAGRCIVIADADEFWCMGEGRVSRPYTSAVLTNPTWGQLFACAKSAQKKTGDLHHCFFEGVQRSPHKRVVKGEAVAVLRLALGS